MLKVEEIRKIQHEAEKKMTAAHRIRKTAMESLGLGSFSYTKLSCKDKSRVDKVAHEIAADILGETP